MIKYSAILFASIFIISGQAIAAKDVEPVDHDAHSGHNMDHGGQDDHDMSHDDHSEHMMEHGDGHDMSHGDDHRLERELSADCSTVIPDAQRRNSLKLNVSLPSPIR